MQKSTRFWYFLFFVRLLQNDDYVAIRVYLYNNNYITIQVKAGMTVGDVESQVARKLNLGDNGKLFSLYECCSDGCEFLILY